MKDLNQRKIDATPKAIGVQCDWFVSKAENATYWDNNGREIIDFASGIAVLNVGHRHPKVMEAVKKQIDNFTHTAYQIVPYESYIELAEKINEIAPIEGKAKSCFFTTGGEAVENAIKVAKAYTKRYGLISFGASFHGRTAVAVALTGKVKPYKGEFGPSPAGIYHGMYPNELYGVSVKDSLKSIEHLFKSSISPFDVAAIIFEPIQGEGGFNVAPKEFIEGIRKICDEYNIVMIADEVQTGFGRTGKIFCMEHFNVKPDLMSMAKSLGGGFPISGIVGRAEIMDSVAPGGLGGTYAGSPLATTAGLEVLKIIKEENLTQRAIELGHELMDMLNNLKLKEIAQVRGLGSMVAVEFFKNNEPSGEIAKKVQEEAMKEGLLLLTCGVYGNCIRFLYPLTIPKEQFKKALEILKKVISGVCK